MRQLACTMQDRAPEARNQHILEKDDSSDHRYAAARVHGAYVELTNHPNPRISLHRMQGIARKVQLEVCIRTISFINIIKMPSNKFIEKGYLSILAF